MGDTQATTTESLVGQEKKEHVFHIQIDREHFEVASLELTGQQLRDLPKPPIGPERDLFEVVPGGHDEIIRADQLVPMREGLRFFSVPATINPGRNTP
jgi:hypothetical protein